MRPKTLPAIALLLLASLPALADTPCAFSLLPQASADTITKGAYLSAGDVNGDGHLDVIVSNQQMNKYSVLLGHAGGGFDPYTSSDITNPNAVVVADFNGDHLDDFVMGWDSSFNSRLKIFVSNGDGTFTPNPAGISFGDFQNSRQLVVADFNKDGKLDVAIAGIPGVVIALGNGQGGLTFKAGYDFTTNNHQGDAYGLAMTDFNNDGNADLAAVDISFGAVPLIGNGDGTFVKKPAMPLGDQISFVNAVVAGDFDGDGKGDILAGLYGSNDAQSLKLFTGNGDGTFNNSVDRASIQNVFRMESRDIDSDGDLDVVVTANNPLFTVLRNDGAGNFTSNPFTLPGGFHYALAFTDIDHDGGPDILATEFSGGKVDTMLNKCGVVTLNNTSNANPSNGGSDVTVTATVVSPAAATATGTLTLTRDGPIVASGSVPSISTSTGELTIGAHTFVAEYSGDSRFYPATRTLTQTVQTAPFGPPPRFRATAGGTTVVGLNWFPTAGADHYEIQRGPSIAALANLGGSVTNFYADSAVSAGQIYVYRARSIAADGTPSAYSTPDLTSTFVFTDPTLSPTVTNIKALHVTDLREAIDAARAAAGLGPGSWTDASPAGVSVKALHMNELRTALDQARAVFGLAALMYTDPTITPNVTMIRAVHFDELRAGLQ